ncbi:MAG: PAS domain-containing protein [Archangium sp.]|nr:PAS domain-containing protein [Archangium sp.]
MTRPSIEFLRVIESLSEGVVVHDAAGQIVEFNQCALEVLGLSADQLLGKSDVDPRWALLRADLTPLPPDEVPSVEARLTRRPIYRRRIGVRLPGGDYRELVVSALPLLSPSGEVEQVVAVFLDISRELAVVNELRVFELFFELSADLFVVATPDHRVLEVNDAVKTVLGWPSEKYFGRGLLELVHPDDVALTLSQAAEYTTRLQAADGSYRSIGWHVARGSTPHLGEALFLRGTDVTQRLAEQRQIGRSRELLDEAFELAELAVIERDLVESTAHLTSRLRELLQLDEGSGLTATTLDQFIATDDLPRYRAYLQALTPNTPPPPLQLRLRTARDEPREVRLWARRITDGSGVGTRELVVIQDVTQQSLLQAKLRLAERLTSLGTMAAGVAHEINNPLAFVLANLNVVKGELAALPPIPGVDLVDLRDAVNEALEGAERVRQIVLGLKPFARIDEHQRGHCDVVRIVEASLNMAKNELRHRARIVTDFQPISAVFANEARLGQVFLNLLVNAAHAMPDGHAAENRVTVATRQDGDQVVVAVSDTGRGIPAEVLPRIFDPFFSTKQIGEGTGLGLFISQGIVKDAGGVISVTSTLGAGSTFEVRLPVAVGTFTGSSTTPVPARRRARVLLVDDEPSILRSLQRLLSKSHDLTLAHSGREALAKLNAGLEYDLVLCDLMMPEVSGIDVWEQLTPAQRQIFVFMTGGTFTERAERFLAATNPPVLEKPFTATTLEGLLLKASRDER